MTQGKPPKKGTVAREAARKHIDILDELLSTKTPIAHPDVEGLHKITHLTSESEPKQKSKSRASRSRRKKKSTHYLEEELFGKLEKTRDLLKDMVPQDARRGVTKSAIVSHAVAILMQEFASKGDKSILLKKILSAVNVPERRDSGKTKNKM